MEETYPEEKNRRSSESMTSKKEKKKWGEKKKKLKISQESLFKQPKVYYITVNPGNE